MPGSSYEDLTRQALATLLPGVHWQERVRPNFLKYTTGRNLELDLYDPEHRIAIEVQGGQHYRSVEGMSDEEHSRKQQERDTFKRQRCADMRIRLFEVSIFDLTDDRLYRLYCDIHRLIYPQMPPQPRSLIQRQPEFQSILRQADKLSRQSRPAIKRPKRKKPGFFNFLRRVFHLD